MVDVTSEVVARILRDHHPSLLLRLFHAAHVEKSFYEIPVELWGVGAVWKTIECFFRHSSATGADPTLPGHAAWSSAMSRRGASRHLASLQCATGILSPTRQARWQGLRGRFTGCGRSRCDDWLCVSIGAGTDRLSREANTMRRTASAVTPATRMTIAGLAGLDMTPRGGTCTDQPTEGPSTISDSG